jgi:hypothetical protein
VINYLENEGLANLASRMVGGVLVHGESLASMMALMTVSSNTIWMVEEVTSVRPKARHTSACSGRWMLRS